MEATFREEIRREKAKGRSVLLSSHILAEVESLADRISIIRRGKVVETGSLEQMRIHARTNVAAALSDGAAPLDATPRLTAIPGVEGLRVEGSRVQFSVDAAGLAAAMNVLSGLGVSDLTVTPPSLEDLFLRHYGERGGQERPQ
jgi:ABC-2 type transport system ATP-binding protein